MIDPFEDAVSGMCEDPLKHLLKAYDKYIQQANDENKYKTGWMPVCVAEFYQNDYIEICGACQCKGDDVPHHHCTRCLCIYNIEEDECPAC